MNSRDGFVRCGPCFANTRKGKFTPHPKAHYFTGVLYFFKFFFQELFLILRLFEFDKSGKVWVDFFFYKSKLTNFHYSAFLYSCFPIQVELFLLVGGSFLSGRIIGKAL